MQSTRRRMLPVRDVREEMTMQSTTLFLTGGERRGRGADLGLGAVRLEEEGEGVHGLVEDLDARRELDVLAPLLEHDVAHHLARRALGVHGLEHQVLLPHAIDPHLARLPHVPPPNRQPHSLRLRQPLPLLLPRALDVHRHTVPRCQLLDHVRVAALGLGAARDRHAEVVVDVVRVQRRHIRVQRVVVVPDLAQRALDRAAVERDALHKGLRQVDLARPHCRQPPVHVPRRRALPRDAERPALQHRLPSCDLHIEVVCFQPQVRLQHVRALGRAHEAVEVRDPHLQHRHVRAREAVVDHRDPDLLAPEHQSPAPVSARLLACRLAPRAHEPRARARPEVAHPAQRLLPALVELHGQQPVLVRDLRFHRLDPQRVPHPRVDRALEVRDLSRFQAHVERVDDGPQRLFARRRLAAGAGRRLHKHLSLLEAAALEPRPRPSEHPLEPDGALQHALGALLCRALLHKRNPRLQNLHRDLRRRLCPAPNPQRRLELQRLPLERRARGCVRDGPGARLTLSRRGR
eukprot:1314213-Rhodomonas_salina.1